MAILAASNLQKSYGKKEVLKNVSFEVQSGQVVGLLGPNGAGKTTSFYMMVGLVKPDGGQITFSNELITALPFFKRARLGIGYLPQESSIFRKMSVKQNIACVLETLPLTKKEREKKTDALLEEFHIQKIADQQALSLSGGERRRVEVARALALDPSFLLLDEPFAGIDPIAVGDVQAIILSLKEKGLGILITDHNVRETLKICDLGYLLNDGKILEKGTPQELSKSTIARHFYFGDHFLL